MTPPQPPEGLTIVSESLRVGVESGDIYHITVTNVTPPGQEHTFTVVNLSAIDKHQGMGAVLMLESDEARVLGVGLIEAACIADRDGAN